MAVGDLLGGFIQGYAQTKQQQRLNKLQDYDRSVRTAGEFMKIASNPSTDEAVAKIATQQAWQMMEEAEKGMREGRADGLQMFGRLFGLGKQPKGKQQQGGANLQALISGEPEAPAGSPQPAGIGTLARVQPSGRTVGDVAAEKAMDRQMRLYSMQKGYDQAYGVRAQAIKEMTAEDQIAQIEKSDMDPEDKAYLAASLRAQAGGFTLPRWRTPRAPRAPIKGTPRRNPQTGIWEVPFYDPENPMGEPVRWDQDESRMSPEDREIMRFMDANNIGTWAEGQRAYYQQVEAPERRDQALGRRLTNRLRQLTLDTKRKMDEEGLTPTSARAALKIATDAAEALHQPPAYPMPGEMERIRALQERAIDEFLTSYFGLTRQDIIKAHGGTLPNVEDDLDTLRRPPAEGEIYPFSQ